ncbi:uncharacterized protein LOC115728644 isoform X2 [Rhodamnia argentea]|uniref:Uncharacterized protein LOC115728644 isoform X2 n=1 Tax=Rhodamnia argentea TaxID=178133 RepID=A0A8B8MXK4_9MYRT|nr:uncharacterized protein LOC115728644 isoform X2 [Rhodamnia argentea]
MVQAPSFSSPPPMAMLLSARSRHGCSTHAASAAKGFSFRGGLGIIGMHKAGMSESAAKTANLSASRKQVLQLPNHEQYPISQFLRHPSGVQAILNTRALRSFQFLDADTYRCTLPKIQLLNFEATPVMDLRMTLTDTDCKVEMLSCKFEGSKVVERQNNHFSAFMTNHMRWDTNDTGNTVEVDVKLGVTLEVFSTPQCHLSDLNILSATLTLREHTWHH